MLRITKQADYGLVLMSRLALVPGRRLTAAELAAETLLPLPTVSKVLKLLGRDGLLASHRGAKGGYALAASPDEISVASVIVALDGPIAFTECIEDAPGSCSQEDVCQLRGHWQVINSAIRHALEEVSLADLGRPAIASLVQLRPTRPDSISAETA